MTLAEASCLECATVPSSSPGTASLSILYLAPQSLGSGNEAVKTE